MTELEALRAEDVANVYKDNRLAGTLVRDGEQVSFRYDDAYLADENLPDVAYSLPRGTDPVVATAGAVPPFFAGLLPEGVRLRAIAVGTKTSEDDHLTLLLAVGGDTIGDVRVVPANGSLEPPPVVFTREHPAEDDLLQAFARATSTDPAMLDRVALPGVQEALAN